jgi:hypothetical protein
VATSCPLQRQQRAKGWAARIAACTRGTLRVRSQINTAAIGRRGGGNRGRRQCGAFSFIESADERRRCFECAKRAQPVHTSA